MPGDARALENRRLVPIQAEPGQTVENDLSVFVGGARLVGVFDAKGELAAFPAREQPVEEGGTGPRRRGGSRWVTGRNGRERTWRVTYERQNQVVAGTGSGGAMWHWPFLGLYAMAQSRV